MIVYAGPWAHARAAWRLSSIDDQVRDEQGLSFVDCVAAEMQNNISDWKKYEGLMSGGDKSAVEAAEVARMDTYFDEHEPRALDDNGNVLQSAPVARANGHKRDAGNFVPKAIARPKDEWACGLATS